MLTLITYFLLILIYHQGAGLNILNIQSIKLRPIRLNDIGLFFDVTIFNSPQYEPKETLSYSLNSNSCCFIIPKEGCQIFDLVGGHFEQISPGETALVTLIWPTLTLYDRVGMCNVTLMARRGNGDLANVQSVVQFNTTKVANLLGIRSVKCNTRDLNPLIDCKPANCIEKYLGQRNFFNVETQLCKPVPDCTGKRNMIYNPVTNECFDYDKILTQDNLESVRHGDFDNNIWVPDPLVDSTDTTDDLIEGDTFLTEEIAHSRIFLLFFNGFILAFVSILTYLLISGCVMLTFCGIFRLGRRRDLKRKNKKTDKKSIYTGSDQQSNPFTID